jgi:uncharacterized protein YkwD
MIKHRLIRHFLIYLLLAAVLLTITGMAAGQEPTIPTPTLAEQVVELTNAARTAEGRPPLSFNETLTAAAQGHSEDMAATDFFAHDNPATFLSPSTRIAAAGYDGVATGENIAAGQESPTDVIADWLSSPGHRANIMNNNFREIGVGYVYEEADTFSDADAPHHHYWTQNFGTRADYFPLIINNEAYATADTAVSLYIYGQPWAQEMRFRNEDGSFSGWEPYQPTRAWTLPGGNGLHRVIVELRNGDEVRTAEDTIYLDSTGATLAPTAVSEPSDVPGLAASAGNEYIQIGVGDDGRFTTGTTGGDPEIPGDNERRLLYGYFTEPRTSFTTIRLSSDDGNQDFLLPTSVIVDGPAARAGGVDTTWQIGDLTVRQTLNPALNPYTGREDTAVIRYEIHNNSDEMQIVGLRLMLDVQIGDNDGAPYFVPNHGNLVTEAEFLDEAIPLYWRAFESPIFADDSLRAQGTLQDGLASRPDRFIIAAWPDLIDTEWEYTVDPEQSIVSDSAVALYWNPAELAPGDSAIYITYYGLAGSGGGQTWIDAPTAPTCNQRTFPITVWVTNDSDTPFTNGAASLSLPDSLALTEGETLEKPIGDVPVGQARSASWLVTAVEGTSGMAAYTAATTFTAGPDTLTAETIVDLAECVAAAEPTATATPLPTSTPTAAPEPTATSSPPPTLTPAPTSTPAVIAETTEESTMPDWPSCFPWWLLAPLLFLLLLFLLLWLTPLGNNLRERLRNKSWLCKLLALLTFLYTLFLIALIAKALLAGLCRIDRVYFWRIAAGEPQGIYSTEFGVGGAPEPFTAVNDTSGCVGCHTVSLATSQLAAVTDGAAGQVIVRTLDGAEAAIPAINASYLAWSPDGTRLAVSLNDEDIYVLDTQTGDMTPLEGASEPDQLETMPAWSPDGQSIAFVRVIDTLAGGFDIQSPTDIYVAPAAGGTASPLTGASGDGFNYYPAYSPDGKWLAFTRHTTGETTYADDAADIYLVPALGGEAILLAANSPSAADSWPGWSRDGRWLAFSTNRDDPNFDIYVTQIDETGASGTGVPLPGADADGIFEHLPRWGLPATLPPWWQRLLNLWPWLIPLLLLLALGWLVCRSKTPPPVIVTPPPPPIPPREPLPPPDFLDAWSPPPVWEPIPTLILGVGGAGRHILTQIKKNLLDAGGGQMLGQIRLLLLDTAAYELRAGQNVPVQFAGVELDPETEIIEFGENLGTLIDDLPDETALPPELRDWFPLTVYKHASGSIDLLQGTQGRRPPVRAALVRDMKRGVGARAEASRLWQLLVQAAHDTRTEDGRVRIMLLGSLAGGTGSALIADLAYLARRATEAVKAEGASVEAYLVTDAAFARVANNPRRLATNTFAALRELERFQMAQGRPFRIVYNADYIGDPVLGGLAKSRLLDEIYLLDGHRADRPLGNEPPQNGVYASIADVATLFLDKASRGHDMGQHRQNLRGLAEEEQRRNGRIVVGGLGSFTYRLPLYDIVEHLKARYARELIRLLLMGNEPGEPTLSVKLCQEKALITEPELVSQFMRDQAGYAGGSSAIALIGRVAANGWQREMIKDVQNASINSPDEEAQRFRAYLSQTLQTILNGQVDSDVLAARSGKLAYALSFLEQVDQELRAAEAELKWLDVEVNGNVDESLARFKQLPASYRAEINTAQKSLRQQAGLLSERLRDSGQQSWREAGAAAQSVYEWLLAWETQLQAWREQMDAVLVRNYIHDDALVNAWYKTYLDKPDERADLLRRFHWQPHPDGGVCLSLRAEQDYLLTDEEGGMMAFTQALLGLAGYQAREIWERETLASVLQQTVLHSEQLAKTADTIWQNSGPLLRYRPEWANRAIESGVLGVNYQVTETAVALEHDLRLRLAAERNLLSVDITDPYTLLLVRTADVLPLTSLPLAKETMQDYRQFGDEPTAVFAAEYHALKYERQMMSELRQSPRVLHPAVVTGLNEPARARLYALAYGAGWIQRTGTEARLEIPGHAPIILANRPRDPLHPVVLGFIQFAVWESAEDVARLQEAVANAGADVEGIWRRWTRPDWTSAAPDLWQGNNAPAQDLAVVTTLIVREEVRRRVANR